MFVSLLQPSLFMSLISRSYAQIPGFRWFLTAMAIYSSPWVAPSDFQQGENYRMIYVHVPAARMSLLVHIAVAISSFPFLLTKHPLLPRFSGTGLGIGAFPTLLTLVTGGFRGKPMRGTFRVWDARLTPVFISSFIYPGALCFQKLSVELASISIRIGLINTPITKSPVNWWNTPHQPGSISQFGTSIHVSMPIPILFDSANSPFPTCISLVLETRLLTPSPLESSFITEARSSPNEGIYAGTSSMMPPRAQTRSYCPSDEQDSARSNTQ